MVPRRTHGEEGGVAFTGTQARGGLEPCSGRPESRLKRSGNDRRVGVEMAASLSTELSEGGEVAGTVHALHLGGIGTTGSKGDDPVHGLARSDTGEDCLQAGRALGMERPRLVQGEGLVVANEHRHLRHGTAR